MYDITAVFSETLPVYKGDPAVSIRPHYELSKGDGCNVSLLSFGSHTGTHVDVPKHFVEGGESCDRMPLDYFYGPATVYDLTGHGDIDLEAVKSLPIQKGDITLFKTDNANRMHEPDFYEDYAAIMPEAAQWLVEQGVKTVGIDYLSVEKYHSPGVTHRILLGAGVAVIEGLILAHVPPGKYRLIALPLKIADGDGSPVRAVLVAEDAS